MSNGYAGYAARREGKGQADIGAAVTEGVSQIQSTREKELTRRGELSDIYVASQTALKDIPTHQDDGINNWLQNSTTYIKKQMYDDFQLLKKGKISDNEYRTKHSNLLDAWKKFSTIAQNWNADTEAVLKGVEAGEDGELPALAQFSLFMLGEKDILTDYEKTTLTMGPNGYLSVARYVTEEEANDPAFKKENPGLKEGDMMGTAHELDKLVDPQNVLSNYWDRAKNATAVTKDLAAKEVLVKGDDGKLRRSDDPKARATYDEIKSNAIEAQTSVDRTVANAATSMKLATGFYATEKKRKEMINETMNSGSVRRTIKDRTEELIGEGKVDKDAIEKRAKEIHKEATKAKDIMTMAEARELALEEFKKSGLQYDEAEAQARKEAYGRAAMQLIKASKNDKSIWQPLFDDGGSIVAEEDMSISYREWDPEDGETYPRTEHFKKGDTVPIGKYQKKNVEAQMSQDIDTYAGGKITKDPAQGKKTDTVETETQRRARLKVEDEAKNAYLLGRDVAHGNQLDLLESKLKGGEAYIMKDHIGPEGEGQYFIIKNPKGEIIEEIKYDTDDSGDISAKGYEDVNNALQPYIQGGTNLANIKKKWEKGKGLVGKEEEGKTVDIKTGTPTKRRRYYDLTNPQDFKQARVLIPGTKDTKYTFDQKLADILVDKSDAGVDDLKEFLVDLSPLESDPIDLSKIVIERDTGWGEDVMTVVVNEDEANAVKIKFDKDYGDKTAEAKTRLKKQITDILKQYHEGAKKKQTLP